MLQQDGYRDVPGAAENHRATAAYFLAAARSVPAADADHCVRASMVFSALTLDAFVNQLASRLLDEVALTGFMRASSYKRLHLLLRAFWYLPDFAERPYLTVAELFALKNGMLAGTPDSTMLERLGIPRAEQLQTPMPDDHHWPAFCTLENAELVFADVRAVAANIYQRAGIQLESEDNLFAPLPELHPQDRPDARTG